MSNDIFYLYNYFEFDFMAVSLSYIYSSWFIQKLWEGSYSVDHLRSLINVGLKVGCDD